MKNPLLENTKLPKFSEIKASHVKPAILEILKQNRQTLQKILQNNKEYSWDNLITPLETMQIKLHNVWGAVNHLNGVKNSDDLRKAYEETLPLVMQYSIELEQNHDLYLAIKQLSEPKTFKTLNPTQQKIIKDDLRNFRLSGVTLEPKKKKRFSTIQQELAKLNNKFANNVLDATYGWQYLANENEIQGIPEHTLSLAKKAAEQKNKKGWLFNLDTPSYIAVMTYADSENLRKKFYTAFVTKASSENKNNKKWDNTKNIEKILILRKEMAEILGFKNYAELSLATKMAKKTNIVLDFLNKLATKAKPIAKKEYQELALFVKNNYNKNKLNPWDIAYYSEKLKQEKYSVNEEELRQYFPENQVLTGMFAVAEKIFGMKIKEIKSFDAWHKDVRFFAIYDSANILRGKFYVDLYAREHKRGGAWMDDCKSRTKSGKEKITTPVAYLICNFNSPSKNHPSLLTHAEVEILFHEFGHCLHHLLTQVDYLSASGINNVPWDAVELPSQFMENWGWQPKVLQWISCHYLTKKTLPDKMMQQLLNAKKFQAGLLTLRQLEFALFDFRLHVEFNPKIKNQIQNILNDVRKKTSIIPAIKCNRSQNSFTHIFAGGYAAGYYSYKWAEVLAADAFAMFEENGVFNTKIGKSFLHNILEVGGSKDPIDAFQKFRGRKPRIDALIKKIK